MIPHEGYLKFTIKTLSLREKKCSQKMLKLSHNSRLYTRKPNLKEFWHMFTGYLGTAVSEKRHFVHNVEIV